MATKKAATHAAKTGTKKSAGKAAAQKKAPSKKSAATEETRMTTASGTGAAKTARKKQERDPRLPAAGTVLSRTFKDKTYEVKVSQNDFEFRGRKFASLSAIAKEITGAQTNGFLWFGLTKRSPNQRAT